MDYTEILIANQPTSLFRDILCGQQGMTWFLWKRNFKMYTIAVVRSESM